jgi:hypothetical protein
MGQKLWDEAKVCPGKEVWSKVHLVVIFASLHYGHGRSEKPQSQGHYIDSENSSQDVLYLDHENLYLVPGLEYGECEAQNLAVIVDEYDLLCHPRRVGFQDELGVMAMITTQKKMVGRYAPSAYI